MNPRLRLGTLPTPVEPLPRLSARLGCQLFVKRDDMTGIAFGGNKVRKLEFVLADAVAHGAKTIITVGAVQSNHCRITAALSAKLGLHCILVLSGSPPENPNGNLLLDYLLGTEIVWSTREQRDEMLKQTFDEAWAAGKRPFLIPLGASTPVGTLGYLEGFREFIQQGVEVDWIVVASSSAGTQAGLVLGAIQAGWNGRILGISIDHKASVLQDMVAELAMETADRVRQKVRISRDMIRVSADYLGDGYGFMGQSEKDAIQLFAREEGLFLDPVYTGRAAAGMLDLAANGFFKPHERILFWHTGGTPALFADSYAGDLV
ncbi:MAG TPA: D-cysteine desulfhydrase family protein [Anaerolineaceae bacterium]|nr:D-cysteine desulfhydrase family protein [Anaerolineaceae bacterium]HQF44737.1 D-cysteine desulfhydrase family protein [Anaerolineaceae bacterium]HQH34793.1 D-cysteine desulfhydrase family protein [Anaerolineaceae bacterium]